MTWDGAFNLSDLGGVATATGETKSGQVFRSGEPEFLTDDGWAAALRSGLTDVVDLRNADEAGRHDYHPTVDPHAADGIRFTSAPTEDSTDPEFMAVCGPWLDHPRSYADNLRMYPQKFAVVFKAIAAADGSILIHCAGGRDRTGMVSAMLLKLAGASPEAIADNYEKGFRGAQDHVARFPDIPAQPSPAELDARVAERRPVMIEWIRDFDVRAYLAAIGLDSEEILRLERLLR